MVAALIEAGFRAIEIPLNSPEPFESIEIAVRTAETLLPGECLIGAGTVLSAQEALRVKDCGGNLIVSPNTDTEVISTTVSAGMISMPGVFTATEAHLALTAGAAALKFFPASVLGAEGIRAIKAILPKDTELYAVGGIGPEDFGDYMAAGIQGFGLGSGLYKPGNGVEEVTRTASAAVMSYDRATG
jgi:2-dehydro-3-deoxyphosphogalactonate aldolase